MEPLESPPVYRADPSARRADCSDNQCYPCNGEWRHHIDRLCRYGPVVAAVAFLLQSPWACAVGEAVSSVTVLCLASESFPPVAGAITEECLHLEDTNFARGEAVAQTFLGERPGASASASRVNTPGHFIQQVDASARLTYEVRLTPVMAPPADLDFVPVKVAVFGEVKRSETFQGSTSNPTSVGAASVFINSDPNNPFFNADVLKEQAIQNPNNPPGDMPNFDKIVAISLIPDHTYTVDVVAGCRINGGGSVKVQFSSDSGCSALADPTFSLDQEKLDQQLGSSSFSLSEFYRFEYSAGVSPVPEPETAGVFLVGLAGLAVMRWRRFRGLSADGSRRG